MPWMNVVEPGFLTTVQDLGRFGFAHLGVSPCGAADSVSLRVGNRLAGNAESAAALEMTLAGGKFRFEQETVIALTGSEFGTMLDGQPVQMWTAIRAKEGAELHVGHARGGARCYLCVGGGIVVEEILGSSSTDLRAGFGGFNGRALRRGDRLSLGSPTGPPLSVEPREFHGFSGGSTLRVTRGPQAHMFSPDALRRLCAAEYRVRDDSNRLGVRLSGEPIRELTREQLLTEGVSLGAVQIPPDGQPILLFVDQQTTGGYPKLANVILADLPKLGQLAPRNSVRFAEVDLAPAHAALRYREARLSAVLGAGA